MPGNRFDKTPKGALWTWSVEGEAIRIRIPENEMVLWVTSRDLRHMKNALEVHNVST